MTHLFNTLFAPGSKTVFHKVWRMFENRRAVARLQTLSDAQLKDIGLYRGDVIEAQKSPLLENPATMISELAGERYLTDACSSPNFASAGPASKANSNTFSPSLASDPRVAA